MDLKFLIRILITYILLTSFSCTKGEKSTIFNVKVQTINGDTYTCVDFYKQPAFNHPLLKNHSYHHQMKPNYYLKRTKDKKFYSSIQLSNIWHNGKGCPEGTVPLNTEFHPSRISYRTNGELGYHFAGIRTKANANRKYNGAGMKATLYNPKVTAFQSSGVKVKVQRDFDHIEAGWIVNPNLNRDNRTRLFIFTHTNNIHCYNMLCPGYVHINPDIPIGADLTPISTRGEEPYVYIFFIQRDPSKGIWWLLGGHEKVQIGFWPYEIFSGLQDLSTHIEWGGEVYSPLSIPSPPMGAGDTLKHKPKYDAYCEDVVTINELDQIVDASNTEEHKDIKAVYQVSDQGVHQDYGHLFYYGGVGGYVGKRHSKIL